MKWTNVAAGAMVLAAVGAAYVILGDDQGQPSPQSANAKEAASNQAGGLFGVKLKSTADWSNAKTGLAAVHAMERAQVRGPQGCAERTPDYIEARQALEIAEYRSTRDSGIARRTPGSDSAQNNARASRRAETIAEKRLKEIRTELESAGCIWPTDAQMDAMMHAQEVAIDGIISTHDALTGTKR